MGVVSIGVLLRLVWLEIDGFHWFSWALSIYCTTAIDLCKRSCLVSWSKSLATHAEVDLGTAGALSLTGSLQ